MTNKKTILLTERQPITLPTVMKCPACESIAFMHKVSVDGTVVDIECKDNPEHSYLFDFVKLIKNIK